MQPNLTWAAATLAWQDYSAPEDLWDLATLQLGDTLVLAAVEAVPKFFKTRLIADALALRLSPEEQTAYIEAVLSDSLGMRLLESHMMANAVQLQDTLHLGLNDVKQLCVADWPEQASESSAWAEGVPAGSASWIPQGVEGSIWSEEQSIAPRIPGCSS